MTAFLSQIQNLFSRTFVVASFLPVFIVLFINATIAFNTVPVFRNYLLAQKPADNVASILTGAAVLFATGVVAFLLSTLTTFQRELLEGKHWHPKALKEAFVCMQVADAARITDRLRSARTARRSLRRMSDAWPEALRAARAVGAILPTPESPYLPATINSLLDVARTKGQHVTDDQLKNIYQLIHAELSRQNANAVPALSDHQREFLEVLTETRLYREQQYIDAFNALQYAFGDGTAVAATAVGNVASSASSFSLGHYGMSSDLFWTRLQHAMGSDGQVKVVEDAKAQLDALITLFWLLSVTFVVWSLVLAFFSPALVWFLAVALGGPLFCRGVYFLTLNSYRSFAEVLRSVVDLYRFKVLSNLHIKLPGDLKAEKELWDQLNGFVGYGNEIAVTFNHPPAI